MTEQYRAVGVFASSLEAETALRELIKKHSFPSEQVSIVARHIEQGDINNLGYEEIEDDRTSTSGLTGGLTGGTLGGITGFLIGLGTLAIPGIGPILLVGTATTALATTIAGSAIGAATGTLVGGSIGLGIPKEKAKAYRAKVAEGGYLVIVEGAIDEVQLAEEILNRHGVKDWEVYDAAKRNSATELEQPIATQPFPATAEIIEKPIESHHLRMMGTFPHLSQAKTALLELIEAGYAIEHITLFINDDDRHDWVPNLKVCDTLDYSFNRLPEDRRTFFHDCFDRGQYILMVDGTDAEIRDAELALRTKKIHGFYIFDPHENNNPDISNISMPNSRPLVEIIDRRI